VSGDTTANPEIQMIQAGGANPDPDLTGAGLRDRNLLQDETVETAVFVNPQGAHCLS
jgi:hypothetical protein